MTPEQARQLQEVYDFMQAMKSNTTIPYDVGEAIRERVGISIEPGSKTAASETVTLTADPTNITVADQPDDFLRIVIDGVSRNIPLYND
jgi:hypothetical protein